MNVLIKPIITEKATSNSELSNCYTFLVDPNSNKIQIKKQLKSYIMFQWIKLEH